MRVTVEVDAPHAGGLVQRLRDAARMIEDGETEWNDDADGLTFHTSEE